MRFLRDLSLRHKLILILVFTSGTSLAIASGAFVGYDVSSYKKSFVRELEAQAHIIAYNSAAALTFDDYESASETVGALSKESRVVGAYLLSPEGQVFAQYERSDVLGHFPRPRVDKDGSFFSDNRLIVRAPVEFDGDTIGHVYIEADLKDLHERVSGYVGLATSIVASVLVVVFLLSSRLQRVVSEPILRLANTARRISREKDYGLRAVKFGNDEIGALIDGFNDMLAEIQVRDRELAQHRDQLEEAVVRRTAELWEVNERLRESEERLRTIVEGTSSATGAEYFDALVTTLARALGTRWVMVGALEDDAQTIRTQALWDDDHVAHGLTFEVANTPCEHAIRDSFVLFEDHVAKLFPDASAISRWGVRSYVGVVLRDSAGNPVGILSAFHDGALSDAASEGSLLRVFGSRASAELERMRVEGELLESESRTRAILESAADGIVTFDEYGKIESANRAAEQMFGREAAALIGLDCTDLMTLTADDPCAERFSGDAPSVFAQWVGARREVVGLRHDGKPFPMNIAVGTMRAGGGTGFTAIVRDITRERELEQMKSDFVSTVSHEIRTPLAAIISSAKILLRSGETKPGVTPKFSSIIVEEGKRLTRLINDLLDLSKMDAGKIEWTVKETNPDEIIRHVVDVAEGDLTAKKLAIEVELEESIPSVYVDADKLVQVLTNLVHNAVKFTPEGGLIRVSAHLRESGFVCIGVHDTGIGVAPEHMSSIFERFKQIGNVLTDRPQGTGLGLPICKQIVEYLGGRIWVESEVGKGSTFWFTVPVAARQPELNEVGREVSDESETMVDGADIGAQEPMSAHDAASTREEVSADADAAATSDEPAEPEPPVAPETFATPEPLAAESGARTVLVVEDDPATQELIRYTLETRGFDVITASDVDEAVRLVHANRPALVTLDIVMPGGTGFDVLRAIRADESIARTPVILLSVLADEQNGQQALRLGANAYLTKPFDEDVLLRTVEKLVAHGRRDVLLISDDVADCDALKAWLADQGFHVVQTLDCGSGVTFARQSPPDLILLQAAASNQRTQEVLAELRRDRATQVVPVVLLAGDAMTDGGAVYLGGWSEALRSDSVGLADLLSSLVEHIAVRPKPDSQTADPLAS